MEHTHFFLYNIPAENQFSERPDRFVKVLATWHGSFLKSGKPIVDVLPIIQHSWDLCIVKNWYKAIEEMEKLAEDYFTGLANNAKDITNSPEGRNAVAIG